MCPAEFGDEPTPTRIRWQRRFSRGARESRLIFIQISSETKIEHRFLMTNRRGHDCVTNAYSYVQLVNGVY